MPSNSVTESEVLAAMNCPYHGDKPTSRSFKDCQCVVPKIWRGAKIIYRMLRERFPYVRSVKPIFKYGAWNGLKVVVDSPTRRTLRWFTPLRIDIRTAIPLINRWMAMGGSSAEAWSFYDRCEDYRKRIHAIESKYTIGKIMGQPVISHSEKCTSSGDIRVWKSTADFLAKKRPRTIPSLSDPDCPHCRRKKLVAEYEELAKYPMQRAEKQMILAREREAAIRRRRSALWSLFARTTANCIRAGLPDPLEGFLSWGVPTLEFTPAAHVAFREWVCKQSARTDPPPLDLLEHIIVTLKIHENAPHPAAEWGGEILEPVLVPDGAVVLP